MQRITTTLDDELVAEIDRLVAGHGYQGRSEAMRDLLRAGIAARQDGAAVATGSGVAALIYVYDHDMRDLARRLTAASHDHQDLALATLHVHLDAHHCLEVSLLKGERGAVRHFADHVIAERGVRHGRLIEIPDPAAVAMRHSDHAEQKPETGG